MAIDPSIALGGRPPVIAPLQIQSPLEQYAKVMSLRNLMQENQSGQLGLQAQQLKLQQGQQAVKDADLLRQSYADAGGDLEKTGTLFRDRGGSPQALFDLQKHQLDVKKTLAEIGDKELLVHKDRDDKLSGLVFGALQMPDDQYAAQWPNLRASAVAISPELDKQLPATALPKADLQSLGLRFNTSTGQIAQETARRAAKKAQLEEPGIAADVVSKQAEAQLKQRAAAAPVLMQAYKQGPEIYAATLAKLPQDVQDVYVGAQSVDDINRRALTPEQATTAAQAAATAAETARQHAQQNAFEQVRLGIEKTKSAREENIYQQTYGTGANPALVGVDPKLRTQVTKEAQKIGDEYLKAQEAADQMQSLIELTRTGNKAAGSNLPLIGVETLNAINGIKRINKDEIKQYGGAGSLYDKIVGKLEGAAIGQPIPADVLKDIETMHNTLRQGAESSYKTRLQGINDNYKSNFQPVRTPAAKVGAVPDAVKNVLKSATPGIHTLSDGSKWMIATDGTISKQ
jgi:hypothetical protein